MAVEEPLPGDVADDDTRRGGIAAIAIAICVAGVLFGAYSRYLDLARPGVVTRGGFYGVSAHGQPDQYYYLRTARVLSHWHFPRGSAEYRYGLGYPILAVPFIWLGFHGDPFAPVDALAFGLLVALTFVLGTHLSPLRSRRATVAFGMAGAVVVAMATPALTIASIPFNTNVVVPLGLLVLVIATSRHEVTVTRAVAMGIAVGWVLATRYLDALFLGLPVLLLIVRSEPARRRRIMVGSGAALAVMVMLVLASQQYAFGNLLTTPYHFHNRSAGATNDQSIHEYKLTDVPRHFVTEFVTGKDDHHVRQPRNPLLRDFPLLALMPVGVYALWRRRTRARAVWMSAIVGSALGGAFYLSFVAGGGGDLKFDNARYWAPWYPLWSILGVLGALTVAMSILKSADRRAPAPPDGETPNDVDPSPERRTERSEVSSPES
jgi:hypothetical protein